MTTINRAYAWLRTRRTDNVSLGIVYAALLQLVLGCMVVTVVYGQAPSTNQDVVNVQLTLKQQTLDDRLTKLEALNIDRRISVLEKSASDIDQMKMLLVGALITMVLSLLAQVVQIRGQKRLRRDGDEA